MKKNITHYLANAVMTVCLATITCGCNQNDTPALKTTAEKISLEIRMKQPESITVEENGSRATIAGITISNVWVVQFSHSTNACLATKYYSTNISQDGDFKTTVTTGKDFSNTESNFYVIVNAGSTFLTADDKSLKESTLKSMPVSTSNPIFATLSAPLHLVAGPVKFKPEDGSTGTDAVKAVLVAPLERPYALLEFKYASPAKGEFTPTALTITNLPNNLYVCRGDGKYPDESTINTSSQNVWTAGGEAWQPTAPRTCYMGENLRGSGTATTAREKGLTEKGPDGKLSGCTYIEFSGTYKYDATHSEGVTVTYKFYLGGNLINDYNIQRNTKYAININIGGANSADIRVTVTNGNVAYFEEVKEIKPDYEVIL